MSPKGYIERLVDQYVQMFGSKPKTVVTSPIEKNNQLDDSEFLDHDGMYQYRSLIGSLQWVVSLGKMDITTGVMALSGFHSLPQKGHFERAKQMVEYLAKIKYPKIRFRTAEPDYSDLHIPEYDWAHSVYADVKEVQNL